MKFLIALFSLLAFAAFGAQPEYQRQIFTTNLNAKIVGTGGVAVSSNLANGTWTIDGSGISGGGGSNFIATANGNGTNTTIRGLTVTVGQTNTHLTASKIVLTGPNKELISSAFGESDLATFVTSSVTNGLATISFVNDTVNFASNALVTIIVTSTNGLSRELQFNANQFTVVNGTNINISNGAWITNLNTFGFTNQGPVNVSGTWTNHGDTVSKGTFYAGASGSYLFDSAGQFVMNVGQFDGSIGDTPGLKWFIDSVTGNATFNGEMTLLSNADAFRGRKSRAHMLTNFATGGGKWLSATPMGTRRNWFGVVANGAGIGTFGCQSAASSGTPTHGQAGTNNWPMSTYTTAATANTDVGISSGGTSFLGMFPGKNIYGAFVGRVSLMSTQRFWVGYTSTTLAAINATDTPTTTSTAAIRLSTSAAGTLTNWCFVTCDTAACTVTQGDVTPATTNRHVFEIIEDRDNLRWIAYLDGSPLATNTANLPIGGMQFTMGVRTLENVAKPMVFETIYGEQDNRLDGVIVEY